MSEHQASSGRGHDLPDQPAYQSPAHVPAEPGIAGTPPGGPYPPPPANWPDQPGWQRPTGPQHGARAAGPQHLAGEPAQQPFAGPPAQPSFAGQPPQPPQPSFAGQPAQPAQPPLAGQPAMNPYSTGQLPTVQSAVPGPGQHAYQGLSGPSGPIGPSGYPGQPGPPAYGPPTQQYSAVPWPEGSEPQPRSGAGRRVFAVLAAALLAFGSGVAGVFVGYQLKDDPAPVQQVINAAPSIDESSLATIAAQVMPMVVVITTGSGEGSGVIMSADGYMITNNHVVAGARDDTVTVAFNTGKKVQAKIVGTDPQTDIAVIKAEGVSGLKFATFGDSNSVQVGDRVLAIGSPLGLQGSVTSGIVSALHRTIAVGGTGSDRATLGDAIQTDAPINPGNSGGALVSTKGEVIGINSAIVGSGSSEGQAGNIGLGFAISSNRAISIAEQLIKGGKVSHPYLGVQATDAETGGAQLQRVEPGSPAEKAGLKDGDIVTRIGDKPITGSEDLVAAVQSGKVGEALTLTVTSDGSEKSVTATLSEKP